MKQIRGLSLLASIPAPILIHSRIRHHSPPQDCKISFLHALPYPHAFESDSCGEENAGGPITEGYICESGAWMPFEWLFGAWVWGSI
ncbi:hypothetical protein FIBSPDRAFT_871460 [Athelia psychrophila]|uniref:Uncharacterized protein n=1 Tax=Athelia psychrophila TaxID=1759441 RepID=A0A166A814_9AGAM|nr:hypothetical protein FIBSPDRAFT_871460 [Fibularhizoctonia sp. CBS 109695]